MERVQAWVQAILSESEKIEQSLRNTTLGHASFQIDEKLKGLVLKCMYASKKQFQHGIDSKLISW